MSGYWNRPEATAAALAEGWLHTGDVGYLDQDGYLYLQDRLNDMIVSGGENIYPREVEEVLFQHPGVADAAVIGIPDERFGEAVMAFVVRREGAVVDGHELVAHCRQRIAGYKLPRRVEFIDRLPRNATGKVLRRELREPFWQGRARRIG
jgi:acyl-CoA synthetase (AMP-forming)/AMP-acid ligase II